MRKKLNFNLFSTKYFCIVAFPGSNQGWKGIWGIQERSQRRELKSSQKYKVPESKTQANSEKIVNAIMQTQKGSEMTGLQATVTPRGSRAATEVYKEGRKSPRWKSILSFCFGFSEILPAHEKCFPQHANMISFPLAQGREVPGTCLSRSKATGALWGAHSGALSFLEEQNTLCLSPKQHVN